MTNPKFTRRTFNAGAALALLLPKAVWAQPRPAPNTRTLNFLVDPEPTSLVAITDTGVGTNLVTSKTTEGLFNYTNDFAQIPSLALSMATSNDGKTITFNLRKGVKWHDGKPFTSADAAFSFETLKKAHPRGRTTFANVTTIQTPDESTVVLQMSAPAPYLQYALASGESPMIPKHLYDGVNPATSPTNQAPVGTGPFVFKEWKKGSHIIFEKNVDYWDKSKPKVDRIIVRFIPDAAARAIAFETGEVDIGGETPVPQSDVKRLAALPNIGIELNGYAYSPIVQKIEFNLDNPYFKELKVRQAIAHAVNKQFIVDNIWFGYGTPATGPIHSSQTKFYNPNVQTYEFDIAKAERLLDEAGFQRKSDGNRFQVNLDPLPLTPHPLVAEYLKQTLAKIGIVVTIRSQDFAGYMKRVYTDRQFDFVNTAFATTCDPTMGVQRLYWSKNFRPGVPFTNGTHYQNAEVDRLLEAAQVETDPAKRTQLFFEFQRIVALDLPAVDLVAIKYVTIYNKRVKDHTVTADGVKSTMASTYIE